MDSQYSRKQISYSNSIPFCVVAIFLDENVDINERTAFNLVNALQVLGGFSSVVMVASKILFNFVQQFNFYQEMVARYYT
mmetsp:Transcript_1186/g.1194  ORF Transcript_1186/g.1194 Transcript_1186/m.1194 type:complete len:80 (+) Transcript_1186:262-501(+)|eukprot:CAMPEP_0170551926 /NCGR_PEP_ID=MMETSP0211-20121228/9912_1 /TAXON_ID=311385 /ORGANISM="Pseudokeronopsis sp., Strain OXSARD2" /LENGTH=79 /DNA_ID=CAMNT_0010859395 /DNA_START=867 /DNA_END=1106 /DNA_ORIENTATION=+